MVIDWSSIEVNGNYPRTFDQYNFLFTGVKKKS